MANATEGAAEQRTSKAGDAVLVIDLTESDEEQTDEEQAPRETIDLTGSDDDSEMHKVTNKRSATNAFGEDDADMEEPPAKAAHDEAAPGDDDDEIEVMAFDCQQCGKQLPSRHSNSAALFHPCGHHELCAACMAAYLAFEDGDAVGKTCWSCAQPIQVNYGVVD